MIPLISLLLLIESTTLFNAFNKIRAKHSHEERNVPDRQLRLQLRGEMPKSHLMKSNSIQCPIELNSGSQLYTPMMTHFQNSRNILYKTAQVQRLHQSTIGAIQFARVTYAASIQNSN